MAFTSTPIPMRSIPGFGAAQCSELRNNLIETRTRFPALFIHYCPERPRPEHSAEELLLEAFAETFWLGCHHRPCLFCTKCAQNGENFRNLASLGLDRAWGVTSLRCIDLVPYRLCVSCSARTEDIA